MLRACLLHSREDAEARNPFNQQQWWMVLRSSASSHAQPDERPIGHWNGQVQLALRNFEGHNVCMLKLQQA